MTFATDARGNVLGGLRPPAVDAPVAKLSGLPQAGGSFCTIFGTTVPFTPEELAGLYPTHDQFVSAWARATRSAHRAGFLTRADARELIAAAAHSDIGRQDR